MWATAKTREDQFNYDGLKMVPDMMMIASNIGRVESETI